MPSERLYQIEIGLDTVSDFRRDSNITSLVAIVMNKREFATVRHAAIEALLQLRCNLATTSGLRLNRFVRRYLDRKSRHEEMISKIAAGHRFPKKLRPQKPMSRLPAACATTYALP